MKTVYAKRAVLWSRRLVAARPPHGCTERLDKRDQVIEPVLVQSFEDEVTSFEFKVWDPGPRRAICWRS
jgi:hypothetical protein